jgi:sugar phosphate isomerase/epimerase
VHFPAAARERIAIASYPFRDFILGKSDPASPPRAKMALKDFPAHVVSKFAIHKIEPWSEHFLSLESSYLEDLRRSAGNAGVGFANIAADGDHSLYSDQAGQREYASRFYKQWVDVAAALGSPSVRTNISPVHNTKPDARSLAERLKPIAEYAASRNIVVHLENDNPVSEDPFVLVEVLDRVNSPWLRALPDFGNSLGALPPEEAYRGLDQMFARSYGISHVKNLIMSQAGTTVPVDMERVFALAAKHNYKGYFSMEWDTEGYVYEGTSKLIATTLKNISQKDEVS